MNTIEIDFDVFKKLTALRTSENVTYNDVLREVLSLSSARKNIPNQETSPHSGSWTTKGVTFPGGTEFRATYKGETINGRVESGALVVNGKRFDSPSAAAVAIR